MTGGARLAATPTFKTSGPEFVAVVLASSVGTRLFPLTTLQHPKHLLPVAGVPILHRLLHSIQAVGFVECVVAISHDDDVTIASLQQGSKNDEEELMEKRSVTVLQQQNNWKLTVVRLPEDCSGSGQAILSLDDVLPAKAHLFVFPGDLIVLDLQPLFALVQAHRTGSPNRYVSSPDKQREDATACTVLLTQVGEVDEHGIPLKESAKQKKGGLARDEEEIEYMALSYSQSAQKTTSNTPPPRLIWKQSKLDVEEDEDMVGDTPKLVLPKPRLRCGAVTKVRADWYDVHVYALAPWVRRLIQARQASIVSLREDLLPLLISRQFKSVAETFGSQQTDNEKQRLLEEAMRLLNLSSSKTTVLSTEGTLEEIGHGTTTSFVPLGGMPPSTTTANAKYAVRATVQEATVLRSHTVPAYLFANREVVRKIAHDRTGHLQLPENTTLNSKFQSVLLPQTKLGDKVNLKATVVGRDCQIGNKCRLNNVVLLDQVSLQDNTILQNTVVGRGARIGENCNLNDCQVGPGKVVSAGTKEKGETFVHEME